ncbi:MAG: aminopeptidase P family N-terminal domain-containing protein, partial [Anaerolinea sp.]|nr:aminopeptidase P family N-terminal domain-containing protein [Anaerolinea sp.]
MAAGLRELTLPDFGLPTVEPTVPPEVYAARLNATRQRMFQVGLDALIVYGDREHYANLAYLTGYDPRFEEALLILVPERIPTLLIGNEGMAYTAVVPYEIQRVLYQPFSLLGQPRDQVRPLRDIFREAGIAPGMRVGTVGWKYYDPRETEYPTGWIELPAFLVDTLRALGAQVSNATALFMHSSTGLRARNELEQLARFEFVSTYSSQAVRDLIFGVRPGMTELQAVQLMCLNGLELSAHIVMLSGERTRLGLASASSRVIQRGDPVFTNLALWGANTARGGFLVEAADELPLSIRDYVERLVAPYFEAVAAWYETLAIGVPGGALYAAIHSRIGDPFF